MRILLISFWLLSLTNTCWAGTDWNLVYKTLLAEAANQPEEGQRAVCAVMRNRGWNLDGFSGAKRNDLDRFVERQPRRVINQAKRIVGEFALFQEADPTHGSTHFENTKAFGVPSWAEGKAPVCVIGDQSFWRLD